MTIPELKTQLPISTVLHHYGLQANRNSMLLCPFHNDKTPSLKVYNKTNSFHCFGCGKAGDVLNFIQHKETTNPKGSINKAYSLLGITTITKTITNTMQEPTATNYNDVFKQLTTNLKKSQPALLYLEKRSINKQLEIGFNASTLPHLKNCIVFPLKDKDRNIVSLYGRSIQQGKEGASTGSAASEGKHFYLTNRKGLYPCYPNVQSNKPLILTESIIDAATIYQIDEVYKNYQILACYGTNGLTAEHTAAIIAMQQLKEIIFAFDNDKAGKETAVKHAAALQKLLPQVTFTKIELPCKDVNETLQTHNYEVFAHLLQNRIKLEIPPATEQAAAQSPETDGSKAESKEPSLRELISETRLRADGSRAEPKEPIPLQVHTKEHAQAATPVNNSTEQAPEQAQHLQEKSGNIYFNADDLQLQAIGGINLKKSNQLKITIGINKKGKLQSVRQEVNLYNHNQVQQLIQHTCEILDIAHDIAARAIYAFRAMLEHYRDSKQQPEENNEGSGPFFKPAYQLTSNEKSEALNRLTAPGLMDYLYNTIPQTGLIGEQNNGFLLWCCFFSAKLSKPISVVCISQSGSGKSYIIHKVAGSCPAEWQYKGTSFSEQSLFSAPAGAFKHCTMIVEDMTGAQSVEYIIREMISSEDVSRFVSEAQNNGAPKTVKRSIEGPMNFIMATTKEFIYEDNANRCLLVYLDNSKEQDERINTYLKQCKARIVDKVKEKQLQHHLANLQRMLVPHEVWNIYAEFIELPQKFFVQRRGLPLLMQVIDTIVNLHQYQCEKVKDNYGNSLLIPHPTHIEWAFKLTREILFRKSDELTGRLRDLIEFIKQWLQANNKSTFMASELRKTLRTDPRNLNRSLLKLLSYNYLGKIGGDKYKGGFVYELKQADSRESLLNEVDQCVNAVMEKVWHAYHKRENEKKQQ